MSIAHNSGAVIQTQVCQTEVPTFPSHCIRLQNSFSPFSSLAFPIPSKPVYHNAFQTDSVAYKGKMNLSSVGFLSISFLMLLISILSQENKG